MTMSEPIEFILIGFCLFGTGLALGLYKGFETGFKEAKEIFQGRENENG